MGCRYVELSAIIHATEDADLIYNALRSFFGELPYVLEVLRGHYNNPIYKITAFTENCNNILEKLCKNPDFLKQIELSKAPSGEFYARLDKQKFVNGELIFVNADDVIRLKIRADNPCA